MSTAGPPLPATTGIERCLAPAFAAARARLGLIALLFALAALAWWATAGPNTMEINKGFQWRPRHTYLYAAIFGASLAIIAGGRESPFLYFQF